MMSESCARVRELLIEARGVAERLPAEARSHLASCRECSERAAVVLALADPAGAPTPAAGAVDRAIEAADAVIVRRRARLQFAAFLAVAVAFAAGLALAGALGFGRAFLAVNALASLALPFVGFAALRRRAQEEAAWTP